MDYSQSGLCGTYHKLERRRRISQLVRVRQLLDNHAKAPVRQHYIHSHSPDARRPTAAERAQWLHSGPHRPELGRQRQRRSDRHRRAWAQQQRLHSVHHRPDPGPRQRARWSAVFGRRARCVQVRSWRLVARLDTNLLFLFFCFLNVSI